MRILEMKADSLPSKTDWYFKSSFSNNSRIWSTFKSLSTLSLKTFLRKQQRRCTLISVNNKFNIDNHVTLRSPTPVTFISFSILVILSTKSLRSPDLWQNLLMTAEKVSWSGRIPFLFISLQTSLKWKKKLIIKSLLKNIYIKQFPVVFRNW